ncbi:MAG: DUF1957 domain-containing protein [Clostridia bacterium]|nr:MAG: DUF1957 domain-containing protein [Clostridia bacterium]
MAQGYLALILHAHLPYVRHPESEKYLEERWLFEAVTETYIPLLQVFQRLAADGVPYRITLSLTPPLLAMLLDTLLQQRYLKHLNKLRELAAREVVRTRTQPEFHRLALMYQRLFDEAYTLFHERYHDNLISAWKELQDAGYLEIITCAATHGYLPLIGLQREVVKAQVRTGVDSYQQQFHRAPRGIWLPECGYNPGDDYILREAGLQYFLLDTHGLLFAAPRPRYGVFAPVLCPSGVAAFGRDLESSKQVWSAQEGYPGDFDYREFYRDIGYDLDEEYIKPYIHPDGIRVDTGIKYYRITGKTDLKQPYIPEWAAEKAAIHAGNFIFNRQHQIQWLASQMDRPPVVLAPYDAELFGHWWFEGPRWLEFVVRKTAYDQKTFSLVTPGDYLEMFPNNQVATPCMSSWGNSGYNDVWLDGSNDWIYRHLHHAAARMIEMANRFSSPPDDLYRRALNQAGRELLLAQSSDWAFIMKTATMVDYAKRRTITHLGRFTRLWEELGRGPVDAGWLAEIEGEDNIFPHLDYRVFQS